MVPVVDLRRRLAALEPALSEAVARVLRSGRLLLGPELEAFEGELASFTGQAHAVCVASGTAALSLALAAAGVCPDDEVLVPAFTAVPTAAAVCAAGAIPVPVDVDPRTAAMDPAAAARARTERTRAAVPVHLYGRPADDVVEALLALGLIVIEDAAQAHGALAAPRRSTAVAYSFYPTKNLGGIGDGGAVSTDDPELAERIRLLRNHGMRRLYVHEEVATSARMSEVEAAALRVALSGLDAANRRRQDIARRYRAAAPATRWHADHPRHVHHLAVLRVADREAFRRSAPFETAVHYPLALTQQPAYRRFARAACPEAEAWAAECVTVPCFPEMTEEEIDRVCRGLA